MQIYNCAILKDHWQCWHTKIICFWSRQIFTSFLFFIKIKFHISKIYGTLKIIICWTMHHFCPIVQQLHLIFWNIHSTKSVILLHVWHPHTFIISQCDSLFLLFFYSKLLAYILQMQYVYIHLFVKIFSNLYIQSLSPKDLLD